ncbi:DUF434 domain-containing protein [Sulfurisphaera javensis]|uniref:DUF434 domain-containing protein n=1 Tax=Sulfurisphaera javensis TaxID=2049879 RepID=A0AAT9GU99_9CREN
MAYEDYKYLLNRGYNRKTSLDLITGRYNLNKKERLLLYRCTHSDEEIKSVKEKIITSSNQIVIDGYNLAITLLSAIYNDEIFLCDDGFYRDLGLGKRKNDNEIIDALLLISEFLSNKELDFMIFLDSQISKSGEIAKILRERNIKAKVVNKVDKELIMQESTVSSNDFLVLSKAKRIYDVLGEIIKVSGIKVISIK